jgi:hypothetical protein
VRFSFRLTIAFAFHSTTTETPSASAALFRSPNSRCGQVFGDLNVLSNDKSIVYQVLVNSFEYNNPDKAGEALHYGLAAGPSPDSKDPYYTTVSGVFSIDCNGVISIGPVSGNTFGYLPPQDNTFEPAGPKVSSISYRTQGIDWFRAARKLK